MDLLKIPGVGKTTKQDLLDLGIQRVEDLIGKDPEELYQRECCQKGVRIDRCQLYVYRCAVYFANHLSEKMDEEKLKWWNWKEEK